MTQDFMDPEIFADFIIEAKEHLETIEPNLLELEKAPDNLSLLNEIFRPMHSLKGASGFLGLNKMNGLAHKAENILDGLRKGDMAVNSDIMDVILASTDALRQMIDNLETSNTEGEVDTGPIIATLDALMAGETPSAAPARPAAASTPAKAEAASAPSPEAAPESDAATRQTGDVDTWIGSREEFPSYALTAFGEAHLRDFVEEAKDNISNLSDGLLGLEKHPEDQSDMVNDIFRYFHNLKGNSGIIGYQELNSLTHEAETLLNSLRKGERAVSPPLVDLLLLAVDVLEALIYRIDPPTGTVTPFDIAELLERLREAVAGNDVSLPASLLQSGAPAKETASGAVDLAQAGPVTAHMDEGDVDMFRRTVNQQFAHIEAALKGMREDGGNRDFSDAMFRSLTTIQNSSNFMGLDDIKVYAQRTAGIVDQGRNTNLDFSIMADLLEQESAIIRDMIDASLTKAAVESGEARSSGKDEAPSGAPAAKPEKAPEPAPAEAAGAPAAPKPSQAKPAPAKPAAGTGGGDHSSKVSSTIRVDHEKLDHLMNLIGELIINRNRYSMLARQLEDTSSGVDVSEIAQNLTETTYSMARISDDLQDTIMKVRMVPVASVFSRFPRLVRDLSRKSGKEVDLIVEGEDTELDKSVVEVIGDPLVHLIRNSVDHGIETEEQRMERGKPATGSVWLRAFYKGNSVTIEVEDDGKGIDPEAMRQVAIRKGIIGSDEARALDDREAMELIFAPGFSSAEVITDISGRGVGMDVVRTNIKNLKGSISINS
ncbi:MAG: chemotaxis protein CheA, partial [Desulfovibrio sp.]|nr:chemotaxis protein CheA [Desulfovibrio sp.]